eukprot:CAMPEP_0194253154 /NCGR_PEP_ID=MMETSP0158-20130606/29352_1 /TAXON_ID=33649 /ORGANISM="Thalassionema nitzschioides, Strain L26-B" /LENGTH=32 /DNA_ID= /DNA_START= /DNA_END= /DNA_ORIENTATION=
MTTVAITPSALFDLLAVTTLSTIDKERKFGFL